MRHAVWSATALYRAVWRWHFYAGLVCAPFLVILAVTGAIYLFNDEINDLVYPHLRLVPASATQVPLSEIASAAAASVPGGTVTRIDTPTTAGRSVQVFVTAASGAPLRVFVDPGSGKVLGSYVYTHTLVGFADVTHGSLMLGPVGDAVVELAACWGFILTVTGLFLWWPRGGKPPLLQPRSGLNKRAFWKDWHSAVGFWSALLVLFLILTGLPWAGIWGDLLRAGADVAGIGYPATFRTHGATLQSRLTLKEASDGAAPWTLENEPAPSSQAEDPHAHHHGITPTPRSVGTPQPIGLDAVAQVIADAGMLAPYRLSLPRDALGTYIAFVYPDQPEGQRTLYIDQYSGEVLSDIGFADYGPMAKVVELGVQLHMGNYLGLPNQLVMLLPCLAIVFLCISGPVMWWCRRPAGRLGAPKPIATPTFRVLALIVIVLCIIFPLAGASLIAVLALDLLADWIGGILGRVV